MNRTLKLDEGCVLIGEGEVVVELRQIEIPAFALELTLLLSDATDVAPSAVVLRLISKNEPNRFALEKGVLDCRLSRNSAGYLQATLLRAYRDGMAEVNHIHIEGKLGEKSYDLTFMFELSQAPMTPEEAEKMMESVASRTLANMKRR